MAMVCSVGAPKELAALLASSAELYNVAKSGQTQYCGPESMRQVMKDILKLLIRHSG